MKDCDLNCYNYEAMKYEMEEICRLVSLGEFEAAMRWVQYNWPEYWVDEEEDIGYD